MNYKLSDDGKRLIRVDKDVETFNIPNSVEIIGGSAFKNCVNLTLVIIPEGVTEIGEYAFDECVSLTTITIPKSVSFIYRGCFYNCINLQYINISCMPNEIIIWNIAFCNCISLNNIKVCDNHKLRIDQLIEAFGNEKQYNAYLMRNRDYKLKQLENEL